MLEVNDMLFFIGLAIWAVYGNATLRKPDEGYLTNLVIMLIGAGLIGFTMGVALDKLL